MSIQIAFQFPASRYHATPFGRHANEGSIEWPPSPWRLLRALTSVGYSSQFWDDLGTDSVGRELIEALASTLPIYCLPKLVGSHSRHFMPILEKKTDPKTFLELKNTLILDTFGKISPDEELRVKWDVELRTDAECLLDKLCKNMNYLGRSESWVISRRVVELEDSTDEFRCFPVQDSRKPIKNGEQEQVAVLVATPPIEYLKWRKKELTGPMCGNSMDSYPKDLIECIQKETDWWQKKGWQLPPGSRQVFYWRDVDSISITAPAIRRKVSLPKVKSMLLSVTNKSGNNSALPPVTRALPQAELLHQTLVGIAIKRGYPSSVLTGCDQKQNPLKEAHTHAHIVPLDLDEDGHIDHILIWANQYLDHAVQSVIRRARKTFTKGGADPLRLGVAGYGNPAKISIVPMNGNSAWSIAVRHGSRVWESYTPFVLPRYLKKRGKNSFEGQIQAELISRDLPQAKVVKRIWPKYPSRTDSNMVNRDEYDRFRHYVLIRRKGPRPPQPIPFAVRLEFDEPIKGPLCLGYGSHYGLGVFKAVND